MTELQVKKKQMKTNGTLRMRVILLVAQILLPFGLYTMMAWGMPLGAWAIAVVIMISMGVLVWLG